MNLENGRNTRALIFGKVRSDNGYYSPKGKKIENTIWKLIIVIP